jgi:TonB-linked SusC/RagA family outer membrane protein
MKRFYVFFAFILLASFQLINAQAIQVTGKVTSSEDGMPLPGVSILIKGTTRGTVTNLDGDYVIDVPTDAQTLVFSFIGMKVQEVAIEGRTTIDIVLEPDILGLDEVVITAMGIRREAKALGYAVQEISGEEISQAKNMDVSKSLQGKVAGVFVRQSSGMPGATSHVTIRGSTSLTGNNQPLYVIDGMPITTGKAYKELVGEGVNPSNRVLDLNPDDIESITVLKGSTASALYGLRASNGVVVITTKSGRAARQSGKSFLVTFNSNYTFDQITRLPELQSTYAQGNGGLLNLWSSGSWGPRIDTLQPYLSQEDNVLNDYPDYDPAVTTELQEPKVYDNQENFFQTGHTFTNSIDISSSGEFGSFSIGFGRTDQEGIIETTGMERNNAKISGMFKLNDKWQVGGSANFSNTSVDKVPGNSNLANPLFTVYFCPRTYDLTNKPFEDPGNPYIQKHYRFTMDNPYWALKHNHFTEETDRMFGNLNAQYNPWSWLTISYRLGVDQYTTSEKDVISLGANAGRAYPEFAPYWGPDWGIPSGGQIDDIVLKSREINSNFNIKFDKEIVEDLDLTLMLGNESYDFQDNTTWLTGTDITIGGFEHISNTSTINVDDTWHGKSWQRVFGFYGAFTASYKSMIFLSATGRNDYVSNMPRDNRSFFYPSVDVGFIFTELPFLQNNNILPYGKLRASFAQVGQVGGVYATKTVYRPAVHSNGFLTNDFIYPYQGFSAFSLNTVLQSDALRPMNSKTLEFGVDLRFLNNRIGIDYSYYKTTAEDQIFQVPIASSTGFRTEYRNAGELETYGHEAIINLKPVASSNFTWDLTFNFSTYENNVVELAEGVERIPVGWQNFTSIGTFAYANQAYPVIFGSTFQRDENGNMVLDSRETIAGEPNAFYGMPVQGEEDILGTVKPDWLGGVINTFRYKIFSLSLQFDIKQGGVMSSGLNQLLYNYGAAKETEDREEEVVLPGVKGYIDNNGNLIVEGTNDIPIQKNEDYWSTVMWNIAESQVYETSYVRLRELVFNCNLPSRWFDNTFINGISLYLNGRNLMLWTDYPNFDPESSTAEGNGIGGFEYMSLPNTKSYGGGIRLTF